MPGTASGGSAAVLTTLPTFAIASARVGVSCGPHPCGGAAAITTSTPAWGLSATCQRCRSCSDTVVVVVESGPITASTGSCSYGATTGGGGPHTASAFSRSSATSGKRYAIALTSPCSTRCRAPTKSPSGQDRSRSATSSGTSAALSQCVNNIGPAAMRALVRAPTSLLCTSTARSTPP